jgi:hypothetical protein
VKASNAFGSALVPLPCSPQAMTYITYIMDTSAGISLSFHTSGMISLDFLTEPCCRVRSPLDGRFGWYPHLKEMKRCPVLYQTLARLHSCTQSDPH